VFIPVLWPTTPPIKREAGVEQLGREADPSPLSSVEVKNTCSYTSIPPYVFMAWYSVKLSDTSTFTCHYKRLNFTHTHTHTHTHIYIYTCTSRVTTTLTVLKSGCNVLRKVVVPLTLSARRNIMGSVMNPQIGPTATCQSTMDCTFCVRPLLQVNSVPTRCETLTNAYANWYPCYNV
jgi:hypothetical protein